jgi:hypothetical protein
MNNKVDLLDSELLEVWMKEIHQEKFESTQTSLCWLATLVIVFNPNRHGMLRGCASWNKVSLR